MHFWREYFLPGNKLTSRNKVQSQQNKNQNKLYLSNSETQKDLGGSRHSADCKGGSSSSWPDPVQLCKQRHHTPAVPSVPKILDMALSSSSGREPLAEQEQGCWRGQGTGLSTSLQPGLTTDKANDVLDCPRSEARKFLSLSDTSEAPSVFLGPVLGLHFKKVMGRDQAGTWRREIRKLWWGSAAGDTEGWPWLPGGRGSQGMGQTQPAALASAVTVAMEPNCSWGGLGWRTLREAQPVRGHQEGLGKSPSLEKASADVTQG